MPTLRQQYLAIYGNYDPDSGDSEPPSFQEWSTQRGSLAQLAPQLAPAAAASYAAWLAAGGVGTPPHITAQHNAPPPVATSADPVLDAALAAWQADPGLAAVWGSFNNWYLNRNNPAAATAYQTATGTGTQPAAPSTAPIVVPVVIPTISGPAVAAAPANSTTMTAAQYAASRPDILASWQAANNPAYANDPNVPGILGFGSYDNFLAASADADGITLTSGGGGVTTAAAAGGGNNGATVRIAHPVTGWPIDVLPSWNRAGSDAAGNPIFQLVDSDGNLVQWIINGQGNVQGVAYANTAPGVIDRTILPPVASSAGGSGGGGGGPGPTYTTGVNPIVVPRPGAVNLPPGGVSPLFDPTHRLVGYTAQGYEVYRLVDEGGNIVEWYDIPGIGAQGQHYLTSASANDSGSYVATTTRPAARPPGVINTLPAGAMPAGATRALIIGGIAIAGLGIYFATRKRSGRR